MKLDLFHKGSCPFSAKVRTYISENNLESKIEYHDISKDVGARTELFRLSHDEQVPCLVIDGKPLLESDAIVGWLREHRNEIRAVDSVLQSDRKKWILI